MDFSKEELGTIVKRVVLYCLRKKAWEDQEGKYLFLVPEYPMGLKDAIAEYELYGELNRVDFLLATDYPEITKMKCGRMYSMERDEDVKFVFSVLTEYDEVEIYAPSLDFLRQIRDGREENLMVRIALYFLMTGKNVIVRLPYQVSKLPDGRFSKVVRDLMNDLWEMGISFSDLMPHFGEKAESKIGIATGLVTEDVIEEYHRRGFEKVRITERTVVTPLGAERAGDYHMQLIK